MKTQIFSYNIIMKTNVYTKLTFAEILEDSIKLSPYNNAQVAERLGVSKGTVSNWVSGIRKPDIDMIIQICILLDVDIYYMIGATLPSGELRPKEQEMLMLFRDMNAEEKLAILNIAHIIAKQTPQET